MDLDALLQRAPALPFARGNGIPWYEPAFSQRMLREHLSQDHDRASRRFQIIDQQVAWIHQTLLGGSPGRILDLGCGPGLHTSRLAALGHQCTGLDFSPASIAYARAQAAETGSECRYRLVDLREAELGENFDAILMLFGQFNTFAPRDAQLLLRRMRSALAHSGRIALELHFPDYVRALGEEDPSWSVQKSGLFSERPHLLLRESDWHANAAATTERYFILHSGSQPDVYTQTTQAYPDVELEGMLERAGLSITSHYASLGGDLHSEEELFGVVIEARSDDGNA